MKKTVQPIEISLLETLADQFDSYNPRQPMAPITWRKLNGIASLSFTIEVDDQDNISPETLYAEVLRRIAALLKDNPDEILGTVDFSDFQPTEDIRTWSVIRS